MQRRHAAACRLFLFKRAGFSARHLKKQGTRPAAPPGKRAPPALNGDFPLAGNPRAFLPAAKRPGGAGKGPRRRALKGRAGETVQRGRGAPCAGERPPFCRTASGKGGAGRAEMLSPRPPCLERSAWRFKEMIYFWRLALPFAIKATPITPGPVWAPMAAPMLPR